MQLAVALIIVLGICSCAKGVYNGASGRVGSTYGYRYPYYRGNINTVSHGSRYPAYGGWGYRLGRYGHGLGGLGSYGYHHPISSVGQFSQKAHYPIGYPRWGGYSQHYPVSAMSQALYSPVGSNLGGIYRGIGAPVSQSPIRYFGYSFGKPLVKTYGVLYPRVFQVSHYGNHGVSGPGRLVPSYPTGSSVNTVSHGMSQPSIYGSWSLGSPVGQSVNTVPHPIASYGGFGLGSSYGGYGAHYPVGATANTLSRGIYYPVGLRFGNLSSGYNFYYPQKTSSHTTQNVPGLNVGNTYSGYGSYFLTPASFSQAAQSAYHPVGWGLRNLRVSHPVGLNYGNLYSRYGYHYPVKSSVGHGGNAYSGYGSYFLPAQASFSQAAQSAYHPISLGLGTLRFSQPLGLNYGNLYSRYGYHYPAKPSVGHGGNAYSGYGSYFLPAQTSFSQAAQSAYHPVSSGLGSLHVSQPLGLNYGNLYSRYGYHYPAKSSVGHIGNTYSGYGSYSPAVASLSHTTQSVPHPVGLGFGSLQGGWTGYGHGYGLHYPSGASIRPVSQGYGQPIGYGALRLVYDILYPVGQSASSVSHGLHNPSGYGGWGLNGLYGGYGVYKPTRYPNSNLSYGYQSPLAYGGYGVRFPASNLTQYPATH